MSYNRGNFIVLFNLLPGSRIIAFPNLEKSMADQETQPSRRSVIKSAALATVAAAGAPAIFNTMAKADDKKTKVLGTGAHTYEWVDNWAKRPDDKPWGNAHMVQEVEDGRIFVHHTGPESVHI